LLWKKTNKKTHTHQHLAFEGFLIAFSPVSENSVVVSGFYRPQPGVALMRTQRVEALKLTATNHRQKEKRHLQSVQLCGTDVRGPIKIET